ncbi:hypothetical protein [Hyphomonas sp.]|uniref:hypothetical protein n=1 Tax=Hyphomonas sp. TaxID=87 RepID=UPI0035287F6C
MSEHTDRILGKIHELELELEAEFAKKRAGFRYGMERGRVLFDQEVIRRHLELRKALIPYLLSARFWVVVTAPVIYSLIVAFLVLDLWVSLYQAICFRVYGIPQVRRRDYLVFDRKSLAYLNAMEKLNCAYCSYANGVIAYVREVAARTEQYWCPIKQARRVIGTHARYAGFSEYGDAEHYRERLRALREDLKDTVEPDEASGTPTNDAPSGET